MEEREIDLLQLWHSIKKHLILIIIAAIIGAVLAFALSSFIITPKYEASSSMIISKTANNTIQQQTSLDYNDLRLNQELVNTYSEILKTRAISDDVINNLGLDMNYDEFKNMVSVSPKNGTEIFSIAVLDTIPERAVDIANETAVVFKESVKDIMKIDNVQILDEAVLPENPSSPNVFRNTVLGGIATAILVTMVVLLKELLDTSIKSQDDITETFGIPVIGVIPDVKRR